MKAPSPFHALALALVLAACSQANSQDVPGDMTGSGTVASSSSSAAAIGERVLSGGILELGNAGAAVTMDLYVNHDSRYSRRFHSFMPMLEREFVEKGALKIRIIPVSFDKYPESGRHANMLLCAARQGRGRAMHGLLMGGSQTLVPSGIDRAAFDACVSQAAPTSPEDIAAVPTYVIDGTVFKGVPTEADLVGSIEQAR